MTLLYVAGRRKTARTGASMTTRETTALPFCDIADHKVAERIGTP
jgi:hypothetical protein